MSFGRIVKRAIDKKEGRGKTSCLPELDKAIVNNQFKFDFKEVNEKAQHLADKVTESSPKMKEVWTFLSELYGTMYGNPNRAKGFHPSQMASACERAMYYEMTDTPISDPMAGRPDPKLQRIFDLGTWIHTYLQHHLLKAGVLTDMEVFVQDDDLQIVGHADGVGYIDGVKMLFEIKSINAFQFAKLKTGPLKHHVQQASIYAYVLGIQKIAFIYYNKNDCQLVEFIVDRDDAVMEGVIKKIRRVQRHVAKGKSPERECKDRFTEMALKCKNCSHCFHTDTDKDA